MIQINSKCLRISACIRRKYPNTDAKIHAHYQLQSHLYFMYVFKDRRSIGIPISDVFFLSISDFRKFRLISDFRQFQFPGPSSFPIDIYKG
ncbi:unnamed protein product [Meloidogyne enterolobii]|uniref:Uncharacterized protein n=1 Tax=Meloidogyne enterolobii TaxID=390850 RepID=A0ACB0YT23_MELEN